MNNKRWYDLSPEVSMLISKVELAGGDKRANYAKRILLELFKQGYKPEPEQFQYRINNYSMNRWYDAEKNVFLAFEYLKDADKDIQQRVVKNVYSSLNSYVDDAELPLIEFNLPEKVES